jgi:chromosome transmission fidelity protein 1
MMKLNDFMFDTQIDNVNLFKLEKYFQKSEIVKKVNGFCSNFEVEVKITNKRKSSTFLFTGPLSPCTTLIICHIVTVGVSQEEFEKHRPALGLVESFLLALTNKDGDGRILVSKHPTELKKSSLKFLLLNAEVYFEEVLSQARAVILAGGTMQPVRLTNDEQKPLIHSLTRIYALLWQFNDFTMQVVSPKIPSDRLKFLSCQHVVPDENLVAIVAQSGPSGVEFDFSYENRGNLKMVGTWRATRVHLY